MNESCLKEKLLKSSFANDLIIINENSEDVVYYNIPEKVHNFVEFIKEVCGFEMLVDLCGVHYPANEKQFEVVYHFLSITQNKRLRLIVRLVEGQEINTVDGVYSSANWFEREAYDMYGIVFTNSKDLRRILTDYNFDGFPLRKDFPLTGHNEVRYDAIKGEIVYEPVSLAQDYRNFDFSSNWVGKNE